MRGEQGRPTGEYAVLADEPVVLEKPRRAVAKVAIAYMAAILIVGVSAIYIGYGLARRDLDRRVAAIEQYQNERRDVRDQEKQDADAEREATAARVERLKQIVCVFADRAQPRDEDVQRIRQEFGCTGEPVAPATPGALLPPPSPGGRATPGPRTGTPRGGVPGTLPAPAPQPPPAVPPPAEPEPDDEDDGILCLPIIGCLL